MAVKMKLQATTTATITTTVKLSPKARQMVKVRCDEHVKLGKIAKEASARQKRIRAEVDEVFSKEGQGRALLSTAPCSTPTNSRWSRASVRSSTRLAS